MWVTSRNLGALLEAGLKVDFFRAYNSRLQQTVASQIATVVDTTLPEQEYGWLGDLPSVREFVDERMIRHLKKYEYKISDKVYEATIGIERKALEDEQYNMIRTRVADLGAQMAVFQEKTLVNLLESGFNTVGPDGQYFFDTDHGESGSAQSNVTSNTLNAANLQAAISAMEQFRTDQGEIMGVSPSHLLVGPSLRWRAMELLNSTVVVASSGTNYINVLQGALTLLVSPFVQGYHWFVLDLRRPLRPLILQRRSDVPLEVSALTNPEASETLFMRDMVYFGARARFGVGYGIWQLAYGSNATT